MENLNLDIGEVEDEGIEKSRVWSSLIAKPAYQDYTTEEKEGIRNAFFGLPNEDFSRKKHEEPKDGLSVLSNSRRQELKSKGPIGIAELFQRSEMKEYAPFISGVSEAFDARNLYVKVKKIQEGNYTNEIDKQTDVNYVRSYLEELEELNIRGVTIPANIAKGVSKMPAFLVEFVLTGGLANLIVKGGKKAVVSAVKTSVTRKAKQLATVVGVQTALNPQRTVEKYYSRRVEYTTKGFNILKDSVETPATSFFKAFFDVYIELGTEHAGGFVSDLGLGRASAKLAQSRVGKRLAYGLRKLAVEGKGKEVNKMLSRAGFHGVLAEIGEERLYDLISGVTGVREQPGNPRPIFDRIMDVIPEADKFLVEAGVISIVGGASRSTGLAIDLLARNKKSVKGYDVKYEVSEEDKDSLVEAAYKPTKYSLNIEEATEYNKALQDLSSEDVDISLKSLAVVAKHESRLDSTKTKKNKTNEIIGKIKTMLRVVDEQNTPRDLDIDLDRAEDSFLNTVAEGQFKSHVTVESVLDGLVDVQLPSSMVKSMNNLLTSLRGIHNKSQEDRIHRELEANIAQDLEVKEQKGSLANTIAKIDRYITKYVSNRADLMSALHKSKTMKEVKRTASLVIQAKRDKEKEALIVKLKDRTSIDGVKGLPGAAVQINRGMRKLMDPDVKSSKYARDMFSDHLNTFLADKVKKGILDKGEASLIKNSLVKFRGLNNLESVRSVSLALDLVNHVANKDRVRLKGSRKLNLKLDSLRILSDENVKAGSVEDLSNFGSMIEKLKGKVGNVSKEAQRILLPIDFVLNSMDGNVNFNGLLTKIFKNRLDTKHNGYLKETHAMITELKAKEKELGLTKSDYEAIGLYAIKKQKGGIARLVNMGYTTEFLVNHELSVDQLAMYTFMSENLESLRPETERITNSLLGKAFKRVENYFPFTRVLTTKDKLDKYNPEGSITDILLGELNQKRDQTTIDSSHVKARAETNDTMLDINAYNVYITHMDKAMYFKNMAEELTYLKDLIKQEEVQSKLGFAGSEYISDWLSAVARNRSIRDLPLLDLARENLAVTVFTLKASVVLLQTSAFFPAAMRLGVIRTLEGFRQRTLNPKAQDFIKNNLPELVSRKTSLLDLSDVFEKSKMNKYAFSLIKLVDSYVAESVAIAAYVKHATKRGLPLDYTTVDSNLILDIQREVRLTQASPMLKDAPQVYWSRKGTGSNSLNRALFQFQTFMLSRFALRKSEIGRNLKDKAYVASVNDTVLVAMETAFEVIIALGLASLAKGSVDTDEDELIKSFISKTLDGIPIVSNLKSVVLYHGTSIPVVDFTLEGIEDVYRGVKNKNIPKLIQGVGEVVSITTGLPQITYKWLDNID